MKIRMLAPKGYTGGSIGGFELLVNDGVAEVEHHLTETLESHGFTREVPAPIEASRAALVRIVADTAREVAELQKDEVLLAFAAMTTDDRAVLIGRAFALEPAREAKSLHKPPEVPDLTKAAPDEFDGMMRNELFEFLKARGVAVGPATGDDRLRAIARENRDKPLVQPAA